MKQAISERDVREIGARRARPEEVHCVRRVRHQTHPKASGLYSGGMAAPATRRHALQRTRPSTFEEHLARSSCAASLRPLPSPSRTAPGRGCKATCETEPSPCASSLRQSPRLPGPAGPLHGVHAAAETEAEGAGPEHKGDEGREGGDRESEVLGDQSITMGS